ncbi:hypothetical protein WN48_07867 [Eufriesea mexicana]|uniref:uncharacterized protein LOC108545564 n=1 Tax=Eufriesea mexicana TaxID=516756 RepID=UPI00083BB1ED|nr:PREDICTED: uncharacterized protein LOC108545564 [Eufriesea mexicana]XP_017752734.1 PREDICTED: uncharacterized protein LOC108545564 [Eufriesea mexicana]XP_017752735.1 PREDICTED: uncharacterized protein LOC108545564 [Eufriesea mexicana]XP_017752736.1 PREDICTED: uncharacterized protein LOC108545564 [Eufriesea mexicana]OAD59956.1 hypothetical protein WN48_07867 [Eufriesea mexicana]
MYSPFDMINSIPIVGHGKAICHYIDGDLRSGNQAMYEATRTGAVMAGGALGAAGGPVGMAVGGVAGGIVVDGVATLVTGEPQGLIAVVNDAREELAEGKIPIGPLMQGTLMIAGDVAGGLAGGAASCVINEAIGTAVKGTAAREIMKTTIFYGTSTVLTNLSQGTVGIKLRERRNNKSNSPHAGGGPPPGGDGNGWNDRNAHEIEESEPEPFMIKFLAIFRVKSLDDIRFRAKGEAEYRYPFRGLTRKDKQTLKKLIKNVDLAGYLNVVIEIVVMLLSDMEPNDVTFINFISVSQFVATFVGEKVSESLDMDDFDCYFIRESITPISCDMDTLKRVCSATWKDLLKEISNFTCDPYFRDDFAAVYHYYKHRMVPGVNIELSIAEYFDLINSALKKLKITQQYAELGSGRSTVIHLEYNRNYNGTVRTIVKIQQGRIVLSSCYIKYGYWLEVTDDDN